AHRQTKSGSIALCQTINSRKDCTLTADRLSLSTTNYQLSFLVLAKPIHHAPRDREKLPRLRAQVLQNQIRRQPNRHMPRAVEVEAGPNGRHRAGPVRVQT